MRLAAFAVEFTIGTGTPGHDAIVRWRSRPTYPPVEAIPANAAPMAKSTMIAANIANDPRDRTACGDLLTYR